MKLAYGKFLVIGNLFYVEGSIVKIKKYIDTVSEQNYNTDADAVSE